MKKSLLLLLSVAFSFLFLSCDKDKDKGKGHDRNVGSGITNVHAPTSGSDSIKFTADSSSSLQALLFCPLSGSNRVVVRDMTANTNLYDGDVSSTDVYVTGFTPGNNYAIIGYVGPGSSANFGHASSSYRNSGATPNPFVGYTQYFNMSGQTGPADGVVVIIMEEPTQSSHK